MKGISKLLTTGIKVREALKERVDINPRAMDMIEEALDFSTLVLDENRNLTGLDEQLETMKSEKDFFFLNTSQQNERKFSREVLVQAKTHGVSLDDTETLHSMQETHDHEQKALLYLTGGNKGNTQSFSGEFKHSNQKSVEQIEITPQHRLEAMRLGIDPDNEESMKEFLQIHEQGKSAMQYLTTGKRTSGDDEAA